MSISLQSTDTGKQGSCQGQPQGRRFDNFAQRLYAGLPGAKGNPAAAAPANRKPRTASAPKPAATVTSPEVARAAAMQSERERWAAVMASEHAKGRENGCRRLLSAPQHWPAAQIIRHLPHLPTDQAISAEENRQRSDTVWDRARAKVEGARYLHNPTAQDIVAAQRKASPVDAGSNVASTADANAKARADAVWDRARASANGRPAR